MSSKASKLLCLLLVVMVVTISFVGCGGSSNTPAVSTTTSENSQPDSSSQQAEDLPLYTIKVIANTKIVKSSDETEVGKIIKDKFNVVLQYQPYTGDYQSQLNLMLAAGNYPELLRLERQPTVDKYIAAGALLPLDDYLDNSPNFSERYKDQIPMWRLGASDGKLYFWNMYEPQDPKLRTNDNSLDVMVRTDALEKQGWPKLLSTTDYINFIKKAVQDIPTTNGKKTIGMTLPLGESWGMAGILPILFEKGETYTAKAGNQGVIWNVKTQQFEDYFTNKYVKQSFQFFNQLYRGGLLDKEAFTDKADQTQEKLNNATPIALWYCNWMIPAANQALIKAGHPEMQYIILPVQSDEMVQEGQKRALAVESVRPYDTVAITKNAKDPARLFQLVDYFATEEGQILLQSGIEGKDYTVENGKRIPTDTIVQVAKGTYSDPNYLEKEGIDTIDSKSFSLFGLADQFGKDGIAYNLLKDPTYLDQISLTDRQKEAYQKLGWTNSQQWWVDNGVAGAGGMMQAISIDTTSDIGKVEAQETDLRVKMSPQLIMAKSDSDFESKYQSILAQYNKLNPQQVVDKYNELLKAVSGK